MQSEDLLRSGTGLHWRCPVVGYMGVALPSASCGCGSEVLISCFAFSNMVNMILVEFTMVKVHGCIWSNKIYPLAA
jgi:hypothetical protein